MIEVIQHSHPRATMQARRDFAEITKQPLVELPYWFRAGNTELRGLYGCMGWPQKVKESGINRKGYAAVVGVIKDDTPAPDSKLYVMEEIEDDSPENLIHGCVAMRDRWGFGVHPHLLRVFMGDYRPYELITARYNAKMIEQDENDSQAFIIAPPDDFDQANAFDIYVGVLRTVFSRATKRLWLGSNEILANRIGEFTRDDPAITAMGGLIHTLLLRTPWMEQSTPSVFQLPEA
jgi:hypothetical protein